MPLYPDLDWLEHSFFDSSHPFFEAICNLTLFPLNHRLDPNLQSPFQLVPKLLGEMQFIISNVLLNDVFDGCVCDDLAVREGVRSQVVDEVVVH